MDRRRQRPYYDTDEDVVEVGRENIEVAVSERDAWTGLYDENGKPLYREKEPLGFRVRK